MAVDDDKSAVEIRRLRARIEELQQEQSRFLRFEQQLPESEQRFAIVCELLPIPVIITRLSDGKILYANRSVDKWFGISSADLIGQSTLDFYVHAEDRERLKVQLAQEGRVSDFEVEAQLAGGKPSWLSVSSRPIIFQGEESLLGVLLDVTQRKHAERTLRDEQQFLQQLVELHDRDRKLTAFEIHDGIVQDITGAQMLLQSLDVSEDAVGTQEQCLALLNRSINEARRLIEGLSPPILEKSGLVIAVAALVEDLRERAEIELVMKHDVRFQRLAPSIELALYRIIQESLNNIWHHSQAEEAEVEIVQMNDLVRIQIQDAGVGFDPENVEAGHYGLAGIRERSRLLGGRARITSKPNEGTKIQVDLPLEDILFPHQKAD